MQSLEREGNIERKPEVAELIAWGERALGGELEGNTESEEYVEVEVSEGSKGTDFDLGDGPIVDLNTTQYSPEEQKDLLAWLKGKLGHSVDEAPISDRLEYIDGSLQFHLYEKPFGKPGNIWRITRWQNIPAAGETLEAPHPWYVIRSQGMIDENIDSGMYTPIEEDNLPTQ